MEGQGIGELRTSFSEELLTWPILNRRSRTKISTFIQLKSSPYALGRSSVTSSAFPWARRAPMRVLTKRSWFATYTE